jgi:hypothetical protein
MRKQNNEKGEVVAELLMERRLDKYERLWHHEAHFSPRVDNETV